MTQNSATWEKYFHQHLDFIDEHRSLFWPEYPAYLERLHWHYDHVPTRDEVNESLRPSGWAISDIGGRESSQTILRHIADGLIPVARDLRSLESLECARTPDFLPDLVGHLPLAFHSPLMGVAQAIAQRGLAIGPSPVDVSLFLAKHRFAVLKATTVPNLAALRHAQTEVRELTALSHEAPSPFTLLCRLYLWVVEYGLLEFHGAPKVIGGGLLSSRADLAKLEHHEIKLRPFGEEIFSHEVTATGTHGQLFVVASLDDVKKMLDAKFPATP